MNNFSIKLLLKMLKLIKFLTKLIKMDIILLSYGLEEVFFMNFIKNDLNKVMHEFTPPR